MATCVWVVGDPGITPGQRGTVPLSLRAAGRALRVAQRTVGLAGAIMARFFCGGQLRAVKPRADWCRGCPPRGSPVVSGRVFSLVLQLFVIELLTGRA